VLVLFDIDGTLLLGATQQHREALHAAQRLDQLRAREAGLDLDGDVRMRRENLDRARGEVVGDEDAKFRSHGGGL